MSRSTFAGRRTVVAAVALSLTLGLGVAYSLQTQTGGIAGPDTMQALKEALSVTDVSIQSIEVPREPAPHQELVVRLGDADYVLDLVSHNLLGPDSQAYVIGESGEMVPVETPAFYNYNGEVVGHPGSSVWAAVTDQGELHAAIVLDESTEWNIQPVPAEVGSSLRGLYATYKTSDCLSPEGTCGVEDIVPHESFDGVGGDKTAESHGEAIKMCDIGLDADREYYQLNGSNVNTTITDMLMIIGRVELIYKRDVEIRYEINDILVRTSEPDPYSTTSPGGLLTQFRNWWNTNMAGARYDVAHLFTGKSLDGSVIGIANLAAICTNDRYGLVESKYTSSLALRTSLSAHELGHNWSAVHCSGSLCYIMCPTNGGCSGDVSKFETATIAAINSFKNTRTCLINATDPLDSPFFDEFSTLAGTQWIFVDSAGVGAGGSNEPSPVNSLNIDSFSADPADQDQVRSAFIDMGPTLFATTSFWVQHRGTDPGQSLVVEYYASNQRWTLLTTILSDGVDQDWFRPVAIDLPGLAKHAAFRIRFTANGSGPLDDWYVDNLTATRQTISVALSPDAPGAPPNGDMTFDVVLTELSGFPNSGEAWIDVFNDDFSPFFGSNPKYGPKTFGIGASAVKNRNDIPLHIPGSKIPGSTGQVWAFVGDSATGRIDHAASFTFTVQ